MKTAHIDGELCGVDDTGLPSPASPMKAAQANLDEAVQRAYGLKESDNPIAFLLDLNQSLEEDELDGVQVVSPGPRQRRAKRWRRGTVIQVAFRAH